MNSIYSNQVLYWTVHKSRQSMLPSVVRHCNMPRYGQICWLCLVISFYLKSLLLHGYVNILRYYAIVSLPFFPNHGDNIWWGSIHVFVSFALLLHVPNSSSFDIIPPFLKHSLRASIQLIPFRTIWISTIAYCLIKTGQTFVILFLLVNYM